MPQPTTGLLFSASNPPAPTGDQDVVSQSNGQTPFQSISFYPRRATESLYGTIPIGAIQQESYIYAADTGSANAYAVALSPTPSLVAGSVVVFKAANSNTGASTLAVNGGSAIAIKKQVSTALASGDILAGEIVWVGYDGTNFQLLNGGSSSSGVTASAIQQQSYVYASDTGSANAYAVALSPAPTLVAGSTVVFKAANANTGASTLAVNGGSAIAIKKSGSTALSGGEISAGQIVAVVYDGTNFQLVGASSSGGAAVYFGQGYATASAGNNAITLGSTPLAGSLSVYVAGSILSPSAYSVSGTVISLTAALSSGQDVAVSWATSNSTPGGIALSSSISPPTGMTVWFKADALTATDGQTIGTWPDSSGNGNDGTGSAGVYHTNQLNGLPAVTFSGIAYTLSTAIADTGGHTAFVVIRNTSTSSKGSICGGGASSFQYWTCSGTGNKQQGADSTFAVQLGAGTASADTSWHQMNVVMNNASAPGGFSISFRLAEGPDANSASSSSSPSSSITLFGGNVVGGNYLTAQVAEFIYYSSALTLSQIEAIEAYLNNKYGI